MGRWHWWCRPSPRRGRAQSSWVRPGRGPGWMPEDVLGRWQLLTECHCRPSVGRARRLRGVPEGRRVDCPASSPPGASRPDSKSSSPDVALVSPCHDPAGAPFGPHPARPSGLSPCPLPDPCHNGGSCTDGVNVAFCACLPGFQGTFCEEDINECASNPCRNGANCTDCVASYTCTCPTGFSGIHCENNTPDCTERWGAAAGCRAGAEGAGSSPRQPGTDQASARPHGAG